MYFILMELYTCGIVYIIDIIIIYGFVFYKTIQYYLKAIISGVIFFTCKRLFWQ
ncbi:membrane protein [Clostridium acetobutylicum]|nr:membrane protein [Clostridium acetobutylicum]